jgi:hypothetical protein
LIDYHDFGVVLFSFLLQVHKLLPNQNDVKMGKKKQSDKETFKVTGDEILSKVKEIIKEGNARRIMRQY